jgi:hypothetical protein
LLIAILAGDFRVEQFADGIDDLAVTIIRETTRQSVFRKIPKGSISDRSRKLARASVQEYRVHHEAVERTAEIMPWSRAFEDPIPLPRGRTLRTLRDAAKYILALPPGKTRQSDEWQAAIEAPLMAAEDRGPLMHARIGLLTALNRHVVREFDSSRKEYEIVNLMSAFDSGPLIQSRRLRNSKWAKGFNFTSLKAGTTCAISARCLTTGEPLPHRRQ